MSPPLYHNDKLPEYTNDLPVYKPSLCQYGLAMIKTEFNSPYHYNHGKRSWRPVLLVLNSTQLIIYDVKFDKKLYNIVLALYHSENYLEDCMETILNRRVENLDFVDDLFAGDAYGSGSSSGGPSNGKSAAIKSKFQRSKFSHSLAKDLYDYYDVVKDNQLLFEPTTSEAEYAKFAKNYQGEKIHSYTTQDLRFGSAPTLKEFFKDGKNNEEKLVTLVKYKNTLRVRIELKQMLFQFWSFHGLTEWYRHLEISKDLLVAIDDRELSKMRSIPARYTRWWNEWVQIVSEMGLGSEEFDELTDHTMAHLSLGAPSGSAEDKDAALSMYSRGSSVFDRERSMSIVSTDTIATSSSSATTASRGVAYKTYNKLKIYSMDNFYTPMEQHYISNCIPKLNTFDKWTGKGVTISNYQQYLSKEQLRKMELQPDKPIDLFINTSKLDNVLLFNFGRKKLDGKSEERVDCRQFIILQHGLASVQT